MREKLEKNLAKKPDDLALHQEYAALLRDADDPRAELIDLQITLENQGLAKEQRIELEARQCVLLDEHGRGWLGAVADIILARGTEEHPFELKPGCSIQWFRGWVRGLQLDELNLNISKTLINSPEMRLLRRLIMTEPVNATCDYLHEWGLLDKIKDLDLSYGRISDRGALTLSADRSIRKLDSLDLSGNQINEEGVTAIRKSFPKVILDDQNPIEIERGNPADWVDDAAQGE